MSIENISNLCCACKGIRTCLLCEVDSSKKPIKVANSCNGYFYCYLCSTAWPAENPHPEIHAHPFHKGKPLNIPGVLLIPNFITDEEEHFLLDGIDKIPWVLSQSGRRKQDFGPRVNFKKKKIKTADFKGLPSFTNNLIEKISAIPQLKNFKIVELCHLEYLPERGSSIDPHVDDCWLWGEHLVTVNLLSDTILTLSPVVKNNNLNQDITSNCSQNLYHQLTNSEKQLCHANSDIGCSSNIKDCCIPPQAASVEDVIKSNNNCLPIVNVPLPQRSLLILFGPARYIWNHSILRENIHARRIAMTFRELSSDFLEGGNHEKIGKELIKTASNWINVR